MGTYGSKFLTISDLAARVLFQKARFVKIYPNEPKFNF